MGVRIPLKIGILKSGMTQRAVSVEARIPENRLSEIVTGRVNPTMTERVALVQVLGDDFLAQDDADYSGRQPAEIRSRGRW